MFRTLTHSLLWSALISLCLIPARPVAAQMPADSYALVVLQARVLDRQGRPVTGLPLRFTADLNGVALRDNGELVSGPGHADGGASARQGARTFRTRWRCRHRDAGLAREWAAVRTVDPQYL